MTDDESSKIKLQADSTEGDWNGYQWYFIIDSCERLASYTGRTDCQSDKETYAALADFTVQVKTSSQFFAPKTYLKQNAVMNSEFYHEYYPLSTQQMTLVHSTVMKVENRLTNRLLYNDQFFNDLDRGSENIPTYIS